MLFYFIELYAWGLHYTVLHVDGILIRTFLRLDLYKSGIRIEDKCL